MRIRKNNLLAEISNIQGFSPILSLVADEQPKAAKDADKLNLNKLTAAFSQEGLEIVANSKKGNQDKPEEVLSDKKSAKDSFVAKLENQENSEEAATGFSTNAKGTPASMARALKEIEANNRETVRTAPTNKAPEGGWKKAIESERFKSQSKELAAEKQLSFEKKLDEVQQEREQAARMQEIVKQVNIRQILEDRMKEQQKPVLGKWTQLAVSGELGRGVQPMQFQQRSMSL